MSNTDNRQQITIIGAGPVGSLLSIYLSKRNFSVNVYEKREDPRIAHKVEGRSINIALSHRGIRALEEAGIKNITSMAIPMKGRMIHVENGELNFQPYGKERQFINSISRNQLNEILISEAEKKGVQFHFNEFCKSIDLDNGIVNFSDGDKSFNIQSEIIFGADGAFSEARKSFEKTPDFTFTQEFLSHGYKELHIPPDISGKHAMEKNALHIWPRKQFMLIALPNLDGSFTATLFLAHKGENSFENIKTEIDLEIFFHKYFPDALKLMPDLKKDFFALAPSSLATVHCFPWIYKNKMALIGDAAHAITPFYGQGMNAGFEDCRVLDGIIKEHDGNWEIIFKNYQEQRKENGDAIAELALQNFIEMRDLVGNEKFVLRKKIEAKIHENYSSYLPLYSMVTFSDLPYAEALQKGKDHDRMMEKIMKIDGIEKNWNSQEGWEGIDKIVKEFI